MTKRKVLAISGSTRQNSTNHNLIKAIVELALDELDISIYDGLANLPQFNPDNDGDDVSIEVVDFRNQLNNADGVIICTPEYARGVPGALKNAIDWTVSSSHFPHKPTMLITASTDGNYGHKALMETLKAIEAKNVENLQLVIQFAKTKISVDGRITDDKTLEQVKRLIADFTHTIDDKSGEEQDPEKMYDKSSIMKVSYK